MADIEKRVSIVQEFASFCNEFKSETDRAIVVLTAARLDFVLLGILQKYLVPNASKTDEFFDNIASIEDEERRLFYVAVTRAKKLLALVTETRRCSPFLKAIIDQHAPLNELAWGDLQPVAPLDRALVEIRVSNAYAVKDQLINLQYRFNDNDRGKYWSKAVPQDGFAFHRLIAQSWVRDGVRVEVYGENGELLNEHH